MRGYFHPPIPGRVCPLHFESTKSLLLAISHKFPGSLTRQGGENWLGINRPQPSQVFHIKWGGLFKSQPHHSRSVKRALLPKCAMYGFTVGMNNRPAKPSLGRVSGQKVTFAISHNPSNPFFAAGCGRSDSKLKGGG